MVGDAREMYDGKLGADPAADLGMLATHTQTTHTHRVTYHVHEHVDNRVNKLAPCRTDGRLFTTDVSARSRDTKTRTNIKNPAPSNLDIVP